MKRLKWDMSTVIERDVKDSHRKEGAAWFCVVSFKLELHRFLRVSAVCKCDRLPER